MADFSVTKTEGHGRGVSRPPELAAHPGVDGDSEGRNYHTIKSGGTRSTVVPTAEHGFKPSAGLAGIPVIEISEAGYDEYHQETIEYGESKVYAPGDPSHPFTQAQEGDRCPNELTNQKASQEKSTQQTSMPPPPQSEEQTSSLQQKLSELKQKLGSGRSTSDDQTNSSPDTKRSETTEKSEMTDSNTSTTPADSSTELAKPQSSTKRRRQSSTQAKTAEQLELLTQTQLLLSEGLINQGRQISHMTTAFSSLLENLESQKTAVTSPTEEVQDQQSIPSQPEAESMPNEQDLMVTISSAVGTMTFPAQQVSLSGEVCALVCDPRKPHLLPNASSEPIRLQFQKKEGAELTDIIAKAYGFSFPLMINGREHTVAIFGVLEQR